MGSFLSKWEFIVAQETWISFFFASYETYEFDFLQAKEAKNMDLILWELRKAPKTWTQFFCKLAQKMNYFFAI